MGNRQPENTPAQEEVSTSENRDYICSNRKTTLQLCFFSEKYYLCRQKATAYKNRKRCEIRLR